MHSSQFFISSVANLSYINLMTKSHVHILPLSQTNNPDCLLGCVISAPNLTIENLREGDMRTLKRDQQKTSMSIETKTTSTNTNINFFRSKYLQLWVHSSIHLLKRWVLFPS